MTITLPIALATTGAAAIINLWLAIRISQMRSAHKTWVGDGGHPRLVARMRAHSNFIEYTPIVLILIALVELAKGTQLWLWGVAVAFLLGRVLHGFGMDGWKIGRMLGTWITLLVMVGLGIYGATLPWLGQLG
ncbi:MAPEG family protein [Sphingomonas sp.]|uniref:MAPEG family protein n=1 Tax=Sphingomonas sp. TaxID=28214 RepID=UPI001B1B1D47|nr:MAPEG family protein [Sphingomonas sp.]MBO9714164.1 MAPEG family protein [Sphingomonas sp.]